MKAFSAVKQGVRVRQNIKAVRTSAEKQKIRAVELNVNHVL